MRKMVLINGRIHSSQGVVEALSLVRGSIEKIGANSDFPHSSDMQFIDLKGRAVFPGFTDSHLHFLTWARSQETLNLAGCPSIEALQEVLRDFVYKTPQPTGGWYQGQGWNDTLMGREPTRHDLDNIVPDVPVCLRRTCEHVVVANTAALKLAGVTRDTHVRAGVIGRDEDGEPNGILKEDAVELITACIPKLSDSDITRLIAAHGPKVASCGLTELNSDDLSDFNFDFRRAHLLFMELAQEGKLPFRLRRQIRLPQLDLLQDFLSESWRTGDGVPFYQIGPIKLLTDGSLGGHTAFLREPYADAPEVHGIAMFQPEVLNELVCLAHSSGMQLALHAIGDSALDMCLDALERAQTLRPTLSRHLIVHAQMADDRQLARMKALRLGAAIQPCFVPSDRMMALRHLGKERAEHSYRWRTMLRQGLVLSAGSDAPIETLPPLLGVHAAVNRAALQDAPPESWVPEEKLSVAEAIDLYTWAGAWNGFNEKRRGTIAPGMDADLVVLEQDPFLTSVSDIGNIGVAMTLCGGRITHPLS
ncbi:MAG: amidohydrolase [Fretibacterium sp.]|nr:amidohydrolase [Fretibacterium sp.]